MPFVATEEHEDSSGPKKLRVGNASKNYGTSITSSTVNKDFNHRLSPDRPVVVASISCNATSSVEVAEVSGSGENSDDPETNRTGTGIVTIGPSLSRSESESTLSESDAIPRRHFWINMAVFVVSLFLGGVLVSILSPFYSKEAGLKGISVATAGLVFGSVNITQIIFMPLLGKYFKKLGGAKRTFLLGTFIAGACNMLFGALDWAENSNVFLSLSFVIRIASAIGDSAFMVSVYPLATRAVDDSYRSTTLSVLETMFGVGMMVGPTFGGLLYELGGFYLPFVLCGGALVFCSFLAAILLKDIKIAEDGSYESLDQAGVDEREEVDTAYRSLLKKSSIIVPFLILTLAEMSASWLLPSLEPFLTENFSLGSVVVGVLFSLMGITYAAFSPFWGVLTDRGMSPYISLSIGIVLTMAGNFILGPVPFLNFIPKSPWTTGIGLFIMGVGIASSFIVTLTYMLTEGTSEPKERESIASGRSSGTDFASTINTEIPDNEQARGMITSLWLTAENLGGFVGSYCGGLAYDTIGFELGCLVIGGLQVIALIGVPYLWIREKSRKRRQRRAKTLESISHSEATPLLA